MLYHINSDTFVYLVHIELIHIFYACRRFVHTILCFLFPELFSAYPRRLSNVATVAIELEKKERAFRISNPGDAPIYFLCNEFQSRRISI